MSYLYIRGCDETQKIIETSLTPVHLGNDRKDDDDGTNNIMKNVVDAHTTRNKKKQYSHRQVNQNDKGLLMDSGSSIMIVNSTKLVGNGSNPHDWMFEFRKQRSIEIN